MKIARLIFGAIGLLIYLWGVLSWPWAGEMHFLNVAAITVGLTMVICSFLIFRDQK